MPPPSELPGSQRRRTQRFPSQSYIEIILKRATEVIGMREKAMRWRGTPVRTLDYANPVSLLSSEAGAERVLATLTNLEYIVL
jgi:uncharacterized protein (DUF2384 family)